MALPVCALRRTGRVLGLASLAALLLGGACTAAAQERAPVPDFEAGLFEVRIGRVAAQTIVVQLNRRGILLLPVDAVLDMTELRAERLHPDSARQVPLVTAAGQPGGVATFDLRERMLRMPDTLATLRSDEAAIVDHVLYLAAPLLQQLLRGSVQIDFGALTATILRTPPFPVEQRLATEQRRSAARRRALGEDIGLDVPYARGTGGMVLDWNVATRPDAPQRNSSVQGDLGIAVIGGNLTLGGNYFVAESNDPRFAGDWNYTFHAPRSRWMRQLAVGDLLGGGAGLRALRGVSASNTRPYRSGRFHDVELRPEVPAGWSYEVYQDGQLLGFADEGAGQAVTIPLRYGSTPVQVRMIGPAGEEVVSEYRYQVPSAQLAPGSFEYSAGAGRCVESSCDQLAFARADWGVTSRLTVGGAAELAKESGRSVSTGGVRASALPAPDWYATLDVVPGGRSQLQLARDASAGIGGAITLGMIERGGGGITSVIGGRSRWFTQLRASRHLTGRSWMRGVRGDLHVEGFERTAPDRVFASVATDNQFGTSGVRYEHDPSLPRSTVHFTHLTLLRRRPTGLFTYIPLTTSMGVTRDGIERVEGALSVRSGSRGSLNLVARWSSQREGGSVSLSYDALLRHARVSSRSYASARTRSLLTSAGGAVAFAPTGGFLASGQSGTGMAGVAGRVFYDNDGDGDYGPGDEPASGVGITAGSGRVMTDSAGWYRAWGVMPHERTRVAVDTLRDIQSDYVPARSMAPLRPVANMYNRADFALARTREVAGQLLAGAGVATAGGVTLQLTDTVTKRVLTAITFSDGAFYISRVRPGVYELQVAESSLRALAAAPTGPVLVHVSGTGPDQLVEVPPIELRRVAATEASETVAPR